MMCFGAVPIQLQNYPLNLSSLSPSLVKKVECGNSHCLILFQDGSLFGFGGNEEGQLGIKLTQNSTYVNSPVPINFINNAKESFIEDIAVGDNFSIILARIDGKCKIIQFGMIFEDKYRMNLQKVKVILEDPLPEDNMNIKAVYAFGKRKMFVTYNNDVYVGGMDFKSSKLEGYLFLKHFDNQIISLNIGANHCIVMDDKGEVYGIGDNTYGELGPLQQSENSFNKLEFTKLSSPIKKISCGARHTLFLLSNGELFAMGDNSLNQCYGFNTRIPMPIKVELDYEKGKVIDIFAGYTHNFLVKENGDVYTWGDSTSGKLGYNEEHLSQMVPKIVMSLKQKCVISVGLGAQMSVVITGEYENSVLFKNK